MCMVRKRGGVKMTWVRGHNQVYSQRWTRLGNPPPKKKTNHFGTPQTNFSGFKSDKQKKKNKQASKQANKQNKNKTNKKSPLLIFIPVPLPFSFSSPFTISLLFPLHFPFSLFFLPLSSLSSSFPSPFPYFLLPSLFPHFPLPNFAPKLFKGGRLAHL